MICVIGSTLNVCSHILLLKAESWKLTADFRLHSFYLWASCVLIPLLSKNYADKIQIKHTGMNVSHRCNPDYHRVRFQFFQFRIISKRVGGIITHPERYLRDKRPRLKLIFVGGKVLPENAANLRIVHSNAVFGDFVGEGFSVDAQYGGSMPPHFLTGSSEKREFLCAYPKIQPGIFTKTSHSYHDLPIFHEPRETSLQRSLCHYTGSPAGKATSG